MLPPIGEDGPPLPEAVAAFKQALAEARAAEDRLRRVLVEEGWLESPGWPYSTPARNGYTETMLAKSEIQREALNLPAQERIELVVELWDSLAPGEIPVPDWQRDLIRDRLAALENVLPEERSVPWDAVRKRVFSDKS